MTTKPRTVTKFFHLLRNIMLIIGCLYIAFFALLIWLSDDTDPLGGWCEEYPGTWVAVLPDGTFTDITLPVDTGVSIGQPVSYTTVLPDSFPSDTVITIRIGRPVTVSIDGVKRYEFTEDYFPLPGGSVKVHFALLTLTPEDAGKDMTLLYAGPKEYNGSMAEIYWGNSFGIWKHFLRLHGLKFSAAFLLLAFCLAAIMYGAYIQARYKTGMPIVFLSIGVFLMSAWSIFDNFLFQFIWRDAYLDGIMGYLTIMIAPYPFMYFLDSMQNHRYQRLFSICTVSIILNLVINSALHFTETVNFFDSTVFMNISLAIVVCCVFGTIFWDLITKKAKNYIYVAVGHMGLAVFALLEIIQINFTTTHVFDTMLLITGLYFLLLLSFIQVLQQSKKAQRKMEDALRSNTFKSNFLANMSHEIRTPINAIMGMDDMILREKINDNVREYAGNIQNASATLLSIINEILDFSKIESGKMELLSVPYSLSSVINDVVTMIKVQAAQKQLELVLDISPNLPDNLKGDPTKLRQIMINLLNNACKYTDNGSIKLEMDFDRHDDSIEIHIAVSDTGIGISEEDLPKLFQKFERLDEMHNYNVEGTGLGLSITARFVSMMHGTIDVESEVDHGTTFRVTITQEVLSEEPINSPEFFGKTIVPKTIDHEFTSFTAPDARILVVDDNQMNLAVAKGLLKQTEMHIDTCLSGEEMLQRVVSTYYDVILLDHMMPDMDGIEALHRSRTLPDSLCLSTPVIAMTANAISGVREKYIAEGFTDYISKPVRGRELEEMVLKYLPSDVIRPPKAMDITKVTTSEIPAPEEFDFKYAISLTGSETILRETLLDFSDFLSDLTERLNKDFVRLPEEGALHNYQIKVHSLKSSAATVGALLLSKTARLLEVAAIEKNVDKIRVLHPILCEEIAKHYERVLSLFPAENADVELTDAPKDLADTFVMLKDALDAFDYDTADRICEELSGYRFPDGVSQLISALLEHISEFERESAISTIDEILKEYQ